MNFTANIAALAVPLVICTVVAHLIVSIFIYKDAKAIQATGERAIKIMPPEAWLLLCIFGNVPAYALYWAAHHSSLAK